MRTILAATLMLLAAEQARAEDIVIGAGFGLSGRFATYGEDAKAGADLAVAELNAKGGVLGRPLRIDYEDTGADRAKSVAVYRRFAAQPGVVASLSLSSVEFGAIDSVASDVKLPTISVGSATPVANFSPWSFRVSLIVSKAIGPVLTTLQSKHAIKSVGIIYDSADTSSVGQANAVKAEAPKLGLKLKAVEVFSNGEQDFSAQLTNLLSDPPDLLYVGATTNEAGLIISQARALGLKSLMIGGVGFNDPRIASLPGKAAEGVMTYFSFDVGDDRPLVQGFVTQYKAKHSGATPPSLAALGYDAILLLSDAIKRAGGTDRDAVRKALGETAGLRSVDGIFTYKGSGDNTEQRPFVFELVGGQFRRIL